MLSSDGNRPPRLDVSSPQYRRAAFGLFLASVATFAILYSAQALLPAFTAEFGVSPATSSLSLALATFALAPALLIAGPLSDAFGRKPLIVASLIATGVLTVLAAQADAFTGLLILRALTGLALAGIPSTCMAYLGEEIEPRSIGLATGLLIGGNAVGGMTGRVFTGFVSDHASWRWALGSLGVLGIVSALLAWRTLPPSRHFVARPLAVRALTRAYLAHMADGDLRRLFLLAFLLTGGFVSTYNYVGFRLAAPPFLLGSSALGAVFTLYLVGIASSALTGQIADRFGARPTLLVTIAIMQGGMLLTLPDSLMLILIGMAGVTFGFFGAHTVASSWVARRAQVAKGQAASLYLFAYYFGSGSFAWSTGYLWSAFGWPGIASAVLGLGLIALSTAATLPRRSAAATMPEDE